MKQSHINKLERVLKHYQEIEKILDAVYDSIENEEQESYGKGMSTLMDVKNLMEGARTERKWVENKLGCWKTL